MKALYSICMLLVFSWAFFTCGIESFEDLADLNPPMGLEVKVNFNPRTLELTFMSYNYENNFAGFNVYIGNEATEVNQQRANLVIPNVRTENVPTFITNSRAFQDQPRKVTLIINEQHRAMDPLKTRGEMFWIGVSAYDAVYRQNSKCSAPVEVDWRNPP